jgi:hypothetical protein
MIKSLLLSSPKKSTWPLMALLLLQGVLPVREHQMAEIGAVA